MAPQTHDLIQFSTEGYRQLLPAWVDQFEGSAWAVVRRHAPGTRGVVPCGVRGRTRAERMAIDIDARDVKRSVTPESLLALDGWDLGQEPIARTLRAIAGTVAIVLDGGVWGPTGSVGFQLATKLPVVHGDSDVDMIIRCPGLLPQSQARALLGLLMALPSRVDCLLETPTGAVALAEWADASGGPVLLRTATGPVLTQDPWSENKAQVWGSA